MSDRAQQLAQLEKLVGSRALHGSESLCKLLQYLANHSLEHPGVSPKEYQIATEVFGRQKDFDPHVDSMVRVQAGRLRAKLAEYYASEGVDDHFVLEMPKGSYALTFHQRTRGTGRNHANTSHEAPNNLEASGRTSRAWIVAVIALSVILASAVAVATDRFLNRRIAEARVASDSPDAPVAFHVFWKGFLTGPQEPWVIFSNAAFVGRPYIGMRYYNRTRDSGAAILDHYTGVGEVLAVHALDTVLAGLHQPIRVKRGSLFSLDDAKNDVKTAIKNDRMQQSLKSVSDTSTTTLNDAYFGPPEPTPGPGAGPGRQPSANPPSN